MSQAQGPARLIVAHMFFLELIETLSGFPTLGATIPLGKLTYILPPRLGTWCLPRSFNWIQRSAWSHRQVNIIQSPRDFLHQPLPLQDILIPAFCKNTVEFTPGVLPMFPWDLIDRFETSEGFLQVTRQRSHQLLSSHQIGWWDSCLVHGFFKIATLQCWEDVYGCSSRPSYIDHSLIDKDVLGETLTHWWTKSCAQFDAWNI